MILFPGVAASGIDCGAASSVDASSFTISCWVVRTGTGVTGSTGSGGLTLEPIIMKCVAEAEGSSVDGNFCLGFDPTALKFCADFEDLNNGLNHPFTFTSTRSNNTIYHVAVTYDVSGSGTWTGYVNGASDGTATVSATTNIRTPRNDSIQHLGIGTAINSTGTRTGGWKGNISDVTLWNTALSATQISALYSSFLKRAGVQIAPSNLTGYWGLNETSDGATVSTSASIIRDQVGTNHGTAFGTLTGKAENFLSFRGN